MSSPQLKDRLEHDLKDAMRARDRVRMLAIRAVLAAIVAREKEGKGLLTDDEIVEVLAREAKQRRDALAQYTDAGRDDLAQRESDELVIIERYMPRQLSDAEIRQVIHDIVSRTGATSRKDLGRVMGEAMRELRGRADGNRVRGVAEALLSG